MGCIGPYGSCKHLKLHASYRGLGANKKSVYVREKSLNSTPHEEVYFCMLGCNILAFYPKKINQMIV
jgi:hypothetical protein